MKARVFVTLRPGILDPQGKAIRTSLERLGYPEVRDARVGKLVDLVIESSDREGLRRRLDEMCKKLLANPVIEDFRYELAE